MLLLTKMTNFKSIVCFALFFLQASLACEENLPKNLQLVWAQEKYVGVYNATSQHSAILDYGSSLFGFINGPKQLALIFNLNDSTYCESAIQCSPDETLLELFTETSCFHQSLENCSKVPFENITLKDLLELGEVSRDTGLSVEYTPEYLETLAQTSSLVNSALNGVIKGFYVGNGTANLPVGLTQILFIDVAIIHLFNHIPGGLPELVKNGFQWNLTHVIESDSAAQALVRILLQLSESHRLESILGDVLDDPVTLLSTFADFAFGAEQEVDGLLTLLLKIMQFENTGPDAIDALIALIKSYFTSKTLYTIPDKITDFVNDLGVIVSSQQEKYGSEDMQALDTIISQFASGELVVNGIKYSTVINSLLSINIPSIILDIGTEIGVDFTTC